MAAMHIPWHKRITRTIRGNLRSLLLSNHGIGIATLTKNGLLVVDPRDFGVSRSLLSRGCYDWLAVCWLARLLSRDSRLVFAGAHLGALLVPLALRSGSRNIVAFEPNPETHRLLEMNLALNGLASVNAHRVAVGPREGSIRFARNRLNSGNSRVSQDGEVVVAMATLDSVLQADLSAVDLLVMDTEGFEVHAIRGASQTLARTRYFYVEYSPEQLIEQGSTPQEFIERVASQFESMYLPGNPARFFPSHHYVQYLRQLAPTRGLLLNLLFANDSAPQGALLGT
jgi:FkbM family methyltransferase